MYRRQALLGLAGVVGFVACAGCLGNVSSNAASGTGGESSSDATGSDASGDGTASGDATTKAGESASTSESAATSIPTAADYDLPEPAFEGMRAEAAATYVVGAEGTATAVSGTATPSTSTTTSTASTTSDSTDSSSSSTESGVHAVQVWNDGDGAREVRVKIVGERTGAKFDRTLTIEAGDHLNFVFETPDAYTVTVGGDGFESRSTVNRDWDDCSSSATTIRVTDNGTEMRTTSSSGRCEA